MKEIIFVTGSEHKLKEASQILSFPIGKKELNIKEIQSIDPRDIVQEKAKFAYNEIKKPLFVEDTALYIKKWNRFPGALVKWMVMSLGVNGIFNLVRTLEDSSAEAETVICYYDGKESKIFEGKLSGRIVEPRGESNFGWDEIFEVENTNKTFAEMSAEEKNNLSMRSKALRKLEEFLLSKN